MTALWDQIKNELTCRWPRERWAGVGVVVGCSGGADSVALLRALAEIHQSPLNPADSSTLGSNPSHESTPPRGWIVAAHHHHGLRGEAADRDQALTVELARQLGVDFVVGRGDGNRQDEASLRGERHAFLRRVAEQAGARYVALAHSADDNVETLLHHLLRGTGPLGLCGIAPFRDLGPDLVLAHPLLAVRREQIRQALHSIGQEWSEDASNRDPAYQRNWIRHELIPQLESRYPKATESMIRTIESQTSWRTLVDERARLWLEAVCVGGNDPGDHGEGAILQQGLAEDGLAAEAVVVRGLQQLWDRRSWPRGAITAGHWTRLAATLASKQPDRYMLPGDLLLTASGDRVTLEPAPERVQER